MALVFRRSSQVTGEGGSSAAGIAAAASAAEAAADAEATAADRVQTGLDRVATAADRVQTGLDRTAASSSASASASSASAASTSASASSTSATAAAASAAAAAASAAAAALTAPYLTAFGGRLTLQSGNPTPSTDQIGKQNLCYAPFAGGKSLPVRVSGAYSQKDFIASATDQVGLTLALAGSANWAANSIHDVFAIWDSSTLKLATRLWDAGMYPVETLIAAASGSVITTGTSNGSWANTSKAFDGTTSAASGVGSDARWTPSGSSGLQAWIGKDWGSGNTHIVSSVKIYACTDNGIRADESSSLQLRIDGSSDGTNWEILTIAWVNATVGAVHTIPINMSNQIAYRYIRVGFNNNGTNTVDIAELEFYEWIAPMAGRRLTKYDGILVNDASMTARTGAASTASVAQYEGTFLGAIHIDTAAAGQITTHVDYGPSRTYGVWNAYNKQRIALRAGVRQTSSSPGSGFTYNITSQQLWTLMQTGFSLDVFSGNPDDFIEANLIRPVYLDAQSAVCAYECGIAVDNTVAFSGTGVGCNQDNTGQAIGHTIATRLRLPGFAGIHTLNGIEKAGPGAGVVSLFTDCRNTVLEASWMG